jgi:hypothetical protein
MIRENSVHSKLLAELRGDIVGLNASGAAPPARRLPMVIR